MRKTRQEAFHRSRGNSTKMKSLAITWYTVGLILTFFASTFACEYFVENSNKRNVTLSLTEYLTQNYDKGVRPNCGQRTNVSLDFYVVSFGRIEEAEMEFSVFLYYRQRWSDDRLKNLVNSTVILSRGNINKIWTPVTFCSNAKSSDLMMPDSEVHSSVELNERGEIFYSRSAKIVAACYMDLREFPMDRQLCQLRFGTYAENDADMLLSWYKDSIDIENKEMAQFVISAVSLSHSTDSFPNGNFTSLIATFPLERRVGYYVIQTYIPCTFLVMLSWIVFWMSTEETGNRLTVGITTILTIMFLLGYTNGSLPKVSYIKGMDMYLMVSFLFIFLSIAECIIVDKYQKRITKSLELKKKAERKDMESGSKRKMDLLFTHQSSPMMRARLVHSNPSTEENGKMFELSTVVKTDVSSSNNQSSEPVTEMVNMDHVENEHTTIEERSFCGKSSAKQVDRLSRFLFPVMWLVYNLIYFKKFIIS